MTYDLGRVNVRKRNRSVHWDAEHAIYFITFNLFDAIPESVRRSLLDTAEAQLTHIQTVRGGVTIAEQAAIKAWVQAKLGESLDRSHGSCFMQDPRVASIVSEAIVHFDEMRYRLYAWCVMPNHVHVVMSLFDQLDAVLHSWKSFTAKACNRVLERNGSFWLEDYYDRCIRNARDLSNTIDYVLNNPPAAGLRDWPFAEVYSERLAALP